MKKRISCLILVLFTIFSPMSVIPAAAAPVSIMPLGDSITYGSSSGAEPGEEVSYRKALRDKLIAAGYEVVFVGSQKSGERILANSHHEGHGGWCASGCYQNRSDILREAHSFLAGNPPDIVLLHIGTNDISAHHHPQATASAVSGILDEIFRYGREHRRQIWVLLALIINRQNPPCLYCPQTTAYNHELRKMAQTRIERGDRIILVDMENGAGIDYRRIPDGDMWDFAHPIERGFRKMADAWFEGLKQILIPSGNYIYRDFRADRTGGRKYLDGEKEDPPTIPTALFSASPPVPAPTSPAQPPVISEKQSVPGSSSKPGLSGKPKGAGKKGAPLETPPSQPTEAKGYAIQIGAFRDLNKAKEFVEAQKTRGQQVYLSKTEVEDQGIWYRIYIGRFSDRAEAARNMKDKKIREFFPGSFIQAMP